MSDNNLVDSTLDSGISFSPAEGESTRAFEAFCYYHALGPGRRYSAVARKCGVTIRTIKRWALEFDWQGRLRSRAAHAAEQLVEARDAEQLDAAARARAFRERRFLLAEAILDVAERYFERLEDIDLDHMRFPDACRALEFASRLVGQDGVSEAAAAPDLGLRNQLVALLDQACPEPKGQLPS